MVIWETYPEPALTVLGLDGIDIAEPVTVPSPESSGVVHTDGVNATEEVLASFMHTKNVGNSENHTS